MLFLNNAFTKDITEYDGEVLKEVKTVDGKIYLSNGAIIKEGVVGKFFDIATNDKYGTVFEAGGNICCVQLLFVLNLMQTRRN